MKFHTGKLIPWRLLQWACKRFDLCWASCVDLKLYGPKHALFEERLSVFWFVTKSLKPTPMCFGAGEFTPHDYCGMYGPDHPCAKLAVEAEKIRATIQEAKQA